MSCCADFQTNCTETTITPNTVVKPLDDCGDKCAYYTDGASEYPDLMPVAFGDAPGVVVPAPDGTGAMGFVCGSVAADGQPKRVLIQRTGHFCWADLAETLGLNPTDPAEWWPIHQALAAANIYVRF